jgi:cell division protein FtsL
MTAAPSRRTRPPVHPARREGAARSPGRSPDARASGARTQAALAHAVGLDPAARPEPPAPKHLRVAPRISRRVLRRRRRARWAVAGVAALSAASMFLLVTFHVFAVQSAFTLDKLDRQRLEAQRENALLRNRVATRSSATRIYEQASRFGMVRPNNTILITLARPDVTVPAVSATPVTMPDVPYGERAAAP